MNEPGTKTDIPAKAKALFDDSVERLDAATLSKLNQGRHRALDELGGARKPSMWLRWVPVTGVAAAAVLTVMMMNDRVVPMPEEAVSVADFEMLLEDDSLEMFDDLEFYLWLEMTETEANGDVG